MRLILLALTVLALAGCASYQNSAYLVESGPSADGTVVKKTYSPYLELEKSYEETGLLVRSVITLGPERVPANHKDSVLYSGQADQLYRDGFVDGVAEVYFINMAEGTMKVEQIKVEVDGVEQKTRGSFELKPKTYIISEPVVLGLSNYITARSVRVEFVQNGQHEVIAGNAKRMTVEEVRKKYKK